LTAKRRSLKSGAAVTAGGAPRGEAIRPHLARQTGYQRALDYIADDNIEAAEAVLDALDSAMIKLAKNPGIGHSRRVSR
jgi:plasmid stabilization system protein ParE